MTGGSRLLAAVLTSATVVVTGCGGHGGATGGASMRPTPSPGASSSSGQRAGDGYLALGDSVPFGYREPGTSPRPDYHRAADFVGYPELVAEDLHLTLSNASCPGETTASFLSTTAQSNGCENRPKQFGGYRTVYPLHVRYSGSQLDYATTYLRSHRDTSLVTLMLGANDGLLCQMTKDHCRSELSALTTHITTTLTRILAALRATGYRGRLVVVDYYSTDYADPLSAAESQQIDAAITKAAAPTRTTVADGYDALRRLAAADHGDTCRAGLLTRLSATRCGVHPSRSGQRALATAVEAALRG